MVVQTFYDGVTQLVRSMIDAAVGGTLVSKTEEEAFNLIEEMHRTTINSLISVVIPRQLEVSLMSMLSL